MEAKELRPSIYIIPIADNGDEFEPRQLKASEIYFLSKNPDKAKPIPLTEEWLIRFSGRKADLRPPYDWNKNAEDENYDDEYYSKNYDLNGVYFEDFTDVVFFGHHMVAKNSNNGLYYFVREVNGANENQYLVEISAPMGYVHTFQNYYPAFTGEELTLKTQ